MTVEEFNKGIDEERREDVLHAGEVQRGKHEELLGMQSDFRARMHALAKENNEETFADLGSGETTPTPAEDIDTFGNTKSDIRSILGENAADVVAKQEAIDNQQRTLAEKLIESERNSALLQTKVEEMNRLANDTDTLPQAELMAFQIKAKIAKGLDRLGISQEQSDIRLGGSMLIGTEAEVALSLLTEINSNPNEDAHIVIETANECYNQYNGFIKILGNRAVDALIN